MSVLIRGMAMPKNCKSCPLRYSSIGYAWCDITGESLALEIDMRDDTCPLIDIPTPHGRLGDLDALKAQYKYGEADSEDEKVWMMNIRRAIANAPTVIEAERSETDA